MVVIGVTVVDETVSSATAVGIGGTSFGDVSSHVSVVTDTEVDGVVTDTEVDGVVTDTEVDGVVTDTEVDGVVSATTTVVPRTSEVPGSAEDELPPQLVAMIIANRHVATCRFTAKVSQIITVGVSYRMATTRGSTTPICHLAS